MSAERAVIDTTAAEWVDMGPHPAFDGPERWSKTFVAPGGQRLALVRFTGVAAPHFHLRTNSFYMVGGEMTLRDRTIRPGMWGLEPVGAIHPATAFHDAIYGYGMSPGSGGGVGVVTMPPDGMPAALEHAFEVDELTGLVDGNELEWQPTELDGISTKVLHVFGGSSAFAALYRAEAGASLPARRYVGPSDLFVFEGCAQLHDAEAPAGSWINQPAGSVEQAVRFPEETVWLQNTYGPLLDLDDSGAIVRITDGFSLAMPTGAVTAGTA